MPGSDQVIHEGKVYYSVEAAARMLAKRPATIRKMMWAGDLDYTQVRKNGRLLVPAESLVEYTQRQGQSSK